MPQNKIETMPVSPSVSARRKEHQLIRKNNAVSIVAWPSKRTNLKSNALNMEMAAPIEMEPTKTVKNFNMAKPNSSAPVV